MHTTYVEETGWRAYLPFFPQAVRESADELVEERWSWRGMDIHVDRLPAPTAALKVILVHGAGAYGRIFAPWAANLDAEVVAPDLPGYGLSRPNGRVVEYGDWVDCVADLVERERRRDPRPIVLFGGSMGGMLAYSVAARGSVAGLVATCLLDPRSASVRAATSRLPWLAHIGPRVLRALAVVLDRVRVPIRWLTHMSKMANDPAFGSLCAADPLGGGGFVSLLWVRTFLASTPGVEPEDFRTCPALLVHPGADTWTPFSVTQPFFDRLRCDKTLVLLDGAGPVPLEEPALSQLYAAVRAFLAKAAPS